MKVCMLTTSFPRFKGDYPGRPVYELSRLLLSSGQAEAVHVVAPHTDGTALRETIEGIDIHRFRYAFPTRFERVAYGNGIVQNLRSGHSAKLGLTPFLAAFVLKAASVARRCDLIHAHWVISGLVGVPAGAISRKALVMTVRGSALRSFPAPLSRLAVRRARGLISPHPELTDILHSLGAEGIDEIPNPIDFDRFRRKDPDTSFDEEFSILKGVPVVTFVGRLYDFKDPLTLVRAIPHVAGKQATARFLVVGDGPLREALLKEAGKLGVLPYLVLVGERPDPERFLRRSSVFAAISPIENIWSNSLVEAMTAGVPCVVTRSGTSERILEARHAARLVEPGNPVKLAEGILEILENKASAENMAKRASDLLADMGFSHEQIALRTGEVYRRAVA